MFCPSLRRVSSFYDDVAVRERHTQTVVARHQAVKAVDAVLARRRVLQFAALFVQQDNLRADRGAISPALSHQTMPPMLVSIFKPSSGAV